MAQTLRERIPLQRRKVLKKTLGSVLKILVVCGILSVIIVNVLLAEVDQLTPEELSQRYLWIVGWFGFVILVIFFRLLYQILYFLTYFYDVDENNVVIRKGVIVKREITLPFSKITDVYVDQDVLDVVLAIYDVHISTPTAESGQFAHIDGVSKKGAADIRKLILERINEANN